MDIGRYTEHRNIPIQGINESFNDIASPFFCHAGILCKYLDRLEYSNTFIYLGFIMCHIKSIAYTLFIRIKKYLSFLFQIGDIFIKHCTKLKPVKDNINTISFDYVSQSLFCIIKSELFFFLIIKLRTAKRTSYNKIRFCTGFPFTSALFTLHQISPSFRGISYKMKIQ